MSELFKWWFGIFGIYNQSSIELGTTVIASGLLIAAILVVFSTLLSFFIAFLTSPSIGKY